MQAPASPTNLSFLGSPDLGARLRAGHWLVLFGARELVRCGKVENDELKRGLRELKRQVPELSVWQMFDPERPVSKTAGQLRRLRRERLVAPSGADLVPRVLLIATSRDDLVAKTADAFADDARIDELLLADCFLALVRDDMQFDLDRPLGGTLEGKGIPLSPIEEILANVMRGAGISFREQVALAPFVADFLVENDGAQLIVEADGKDFHEASRDADRDRVLRERYDLRTVRLTGRQIVHAPGACLDTIRRALSGEHERKVKLKGDPRLDPSQEKAVHHTAGHARVLAPAGSGKTKVLVSRIVHLMNAGQDPSGILVLAFNKKAATELEDRLHALGAPLDRRTAGSGVVVATLNAFAYRLLKAEGWTGNLLDTQLKETRLLDDALKSVGVVLGPMRGGNPLVEVLEDINRIKRGLISPADEVIEVEQPKGTLKIDADRVWAALQDLQGRRGLISFEDQVFLAADLLLRNTAVRHRWQARFDHVLVDEFQDLNPAQSLLIRLLVAPSANLFAVGDDDQLIYSWRSAEVTNLLEGFLAKYEGADTYTLGVNYRCAREIVRASQRLISHNNQRYPKTIRPAEDAPSGDLILESGDGLSELGEGLVRFITERMRAGATPGEIAVLARTKTQLLAAASALDRAGIPRTPLDGVQLYSTPVAKRLIAYLDTCLKAPLFVGASMLADIINQPNRFVPNNDVQKVRTSRDPWMVADMLSRNATQQSFRTKALADLLADLIRLGGVLHSDGLSVEEKLQLVATKFEIKTVAGDAPRDREKPSDEMILQIIFEDGKSSADILTFLKYCKAQRKAEEDGETLGNEKSAGDENRVTLSSIHAAKGREWPAVCVFDASRPSERATLDADEIEEERRVFYVAMTRASSSLLVNFVRGRPLQFVGEAFLPEGYVAGSQTDYGSTIAELEAVVAADAQRLRELDAAISATASALDRENNGGRLREDVAKLDDEEIALTEEILAARQALERASSTPTGGRFSQLLSGKASPQAKAELIKASVEYLTTLEGRRQSLVKRRASLLHEAATRKSEIEGEAGRLRQERLAAERVLATSMEKLGDLHRAAALYGAM